MIPALALQLERAWYRPARLMLLLLPLEWLFIAVTGLRRLAYQRNWLQRQRVDCPVIVVGNITVGGTGKTPLVIALVRALRNHGVAVAVISRGYGGSARGPLRVSAEATAGEVGDEALLIARSTDAPVFVGRDRVAAARLAVADAAPELIISDDGLQHYALERDVEIVISDAQRGYGNGHRLPVGPLREGRARLGGIPFRLQRGGSDPASAVRYEPRGFRALADAEYREATEHALGPVVHAVAGIANPERFFDMLRALGLQPLEHPFPDHHAFTAADLEPLRDRPIVMTAKDAVKCERVKLADVWVLEIEARLPEGLAERVLEQAGGRHGDAV